MTLTLNSNISAALKRNAKVQMSGGVRLYTWFFPPNCVVLLEIVNEDLLMMTCPFAESLEQAGRHTGSKFTNNSYTSLTTFNLNHDVRKTWLPEVGIKFEVLFGD